MEAEHRLGHALPKLDDVLIKTIMVSAGGEVDDIELSTHDPHR